MNPRLAAIVVSMSAALLGACGTKGPLYVPGVPAGANWPYPAPERAARPADRKPADVPATTDERK